MASYFMVFLCACVAVRAWQPPSPACSSLYDENDEPLTIYDVPNGPKAGLACLCPLGYDVDVCFGPDDIFEPETVASEAADSPEGCKRFCAVTEEGEEACATQCKISDRNFYQYVEQSAWGVNVKCSQTVTDPCCPDRGTLCHVENLECDQPRCTDLITSGCLTCVCDLPPIPYYIPPHSPPDCSFYSVYECCATPSGGEKVCERVPKGQPGFMMGLPPIASFLDQCSFNFDLIQCEGEIVAGADCCPQECRPVA